MLTREKVENIERLLKLSKIDILKKEQEFSADGLDIIATLSMPNKATIKARYSTMIAQYEVTGDIWSQFRDN